MSEQKIPKIILSRSLFKEQSTTKEATTREAIAKEAATKKAINVQSKASTTLEPLSQPVLQDGTNFLGNAPPQTIPLSHLIDKCVQSSYGQLETLLDLLPRQLMVERKRNILEYTARHRKVISQLQQLCMLAERMKPMTIALVLDSLIFRMRRII